MMVSFEKCAETFVPFEAVAKLKSARICISSASLLTDVCAERISENLTFWRSHFPYYNMLSNFTEAFASIVQYCNACSTYIVYIYLRIFTYKYTNKGINTGTLILTL